MRYTIIATDNYSIPTTPSPIALAIYPHKTAGIPGYYISALFAVIFTIFSFTGTAGIYYIATNGSDASGDGTISKPWRSLNKACNTVTTSGSVIHIKAGTYNETFRINLAKGVSIVGEGITSIIKTSYIARGPNDAAILLNSFGSVNGNQSISYIKIDGNNLTASRAICVHYRNNVTIHHCTIVDFNNSGVRFNGGHNRGNVGIPEGVYNTGNAIYDCISNNNAVSASHDSGASQIFINGQNGFHFYNNTLTQTSRAAGMNGILIRGDGNIDLKIHNNTFNKNDQEGTEWNFFFELWHWQGGGEIHDNTFNGAAVVDLCDIREGSSEYGLKIYNNNFLVAAHTTASFHGRQAIDLEEHGIIEYVYMYNNYFKNVPGGIWIDALLNEGETIVNVNHIYIYCNVFENIGCINSNWSFPIFVNGYGKSSKIIWDNISIYNNTMTAGENPRTFGGIRWNAVGSATNISIRNNIIQGFATNPIAFAVGIAGATIINLSIENNLFYNNTSNSVDYGEVTIAKKTEKNNRISPPQFVSPTDFHLQKNSAAVDAGINAGLPYDGSAPDIGAFEYIRKAK